jgi:hypothetical protein
MHTKTEIEDCLKIERDERHREELESARVLAKPARNDEFLAWLKDRKNLLDEDYKKAYNKGIDTLFRQGQISAFEAIERKYLATHSELKQPALVFTDAQVEKVGKRIRETCYKFKKEGIKSWETEANWALSELVNCGFKSEEEVRKSLPCSRCGRRYGKNWQEDSSGHDVLCLDCQIQQRNKWIAEWLESEEAIGMFVETNANLNVIAAKLRERK